jgi:hypothetical protein
VGLRRWAACGGLLRRNPGSENPDPGHPFEVGLVMKTQRG